MSTMPTAPGCSAPRAAACWNYKLVSTQTPIVPIWLGDEAKTEQLALAIRAEGIHVDAIRFPAVPIKSARLRIQMNAGHRREDIDHLVEVLKRHQHLAEPVRRFVAARGERAAALEPSPS